MFHSSNIITILSIENNWCLLNYISQHCSIIRRCLTNKATIQFSNTHHKTEFGGLVRVLLRKESERGEGCLEMSLSGNVWSSDYRPTRPSNVSVWSENKTLIFSILNRIFPKHSINYRYLDLNLLLSRDIWVNENVHFIILWRI